MTRRAGASLPAASEAQIQYTVRNFLAALGIDAVHVPNGSVLAGDKETYSKAVAAGENPRDVVGYLAAEYGVQRPAIWRRLITGGVHASYNSAKRPRVRKKVPTPRRSSGEIFESLPDPVSRDPCPRCGTRGDLGCKHNRSPLTGWA